MVKCCVYPPKSRAVATIKLPKFLLAELCLPSKIESSRNKKQRLKSHGMVVFTLQNREQSQHTKIIQKVQLRCVYSSKLRAVATYRGNDKNSCTLCLPSKIESSRNLFSQRSNGFTVVFTLQNWEQSQHFYAKVQNSQSCVYPPNSRAVATWTK